MDKFSACLPFSAVWEGLYVDHPDDPGGKTMLGITKQVWADWNRKPVSAVTEGEMKAITPKQAEEIYRAWYWNPIKGDELPESIALLVFDWGINSGPYRAAIRLQKVLQKMGVNVSVDGAIGPQTLAAVAKVELRQLAIAYIRTRLWFYRGLAKFPTFGKGWHNRTADAAIEFGILAATLNGLKPYYQTKEK